ncbi:MAG: NUDIX hydrolase [Nanoarchaeota archaeon]
MTQIPQNAKLVFNGILFKIYQWEQKMFDGTYETFEVALRNDNVQVLTTLNDKIILIKEKQPDFNNYKIGLPGGNVDDNETPQIAGKRELLEETGIECKELEFLSKDSLGSKVIRNFYIYIGRNSKKITQPLNTKGEKITVLELTFEDFIKETQKENFRNPKLKEIIKTILETPGELEKFKKRLFQKTQLNNI